MGYFFCSLHKEYLCACGCHGNHTLGPWMSVCSWSMLIVFSGHFPAKRHDGTPLDQFRAKVSKLPLHFTALLLQARDDWHLYNVFSGFPTWNSVQLCWLCEANQDVRN